MFGFLHNRKIKKPGKHTSVKPIAHNKTLYEKLLFSVEQFSFVKAVDVIAAISPNATIKLRSKVNFSTKFNDVTAIEGIKDNYVEIYTNLSGVAGIEGILPDCYVEDFITFNRQSKAAVIDFFDILNNRILSLSYSYMKRLKVESLTTTVERSVVGNIMFSLSGFGFNEVQTNESLIPEQFKIACHSIFWHNTRSAENLRAMLSGFFEVPVRIEQFSGNFISVDESEQSAIGTRYSRFNRLGSDLLLGNKVWDSMNGINVFIGPLDFKTYTKFLPKKSGKDQLVSPLQKMKEMIKLYVPYGINVKLHFSLDKCLVKETLLNGVNRLNKDAFIVGNHDNKSAYFSEMV